MLSNFFNKTTKVIKNHYRRRKFINFNKKIFKQDNKKNNKGIFLVEFNAFHDSHAIYSIFTNYIKKKYNYRIEAFFNYCLTSAPLHFTLLGRIKWNLANILSLNNFAVYRSFNVENIFRPIIKKEITEKANLYFKKNFHKIKKKEDVMDIKIENILIGELLYDSFIRIKRLPTVDIFSNDFQNHYFNFVELTLFWVEYFRKNKIKGLVTSHAVYSYGLPIRIALSQKIPCYVPDAFGFIKVNKDTLYGGTYGSVQNYKKDFSKLKKKIKVDGINKAKKILESRLKYGSMINHSFEDRSSFGPTVRKRFIKSKKRFNVLICTHDFFDAVHLHGKTIFPDFYEWLLFLGKISKQTNFDWYIKNHPKYSGKFKLTQPITDNIVKKFLKNNKQIKLLPNNLSNRQIIEEGVNVVLTVYGSVGSEFPFFSIPVVNAAYNPHISYNFTVTPKSFKQYTKTIKNLNNIKIKNDNFKELYEFYFMRSLLPDNNWLIGDYDKLIENIGGFDNLQSSNFYKYWIDNFDHKKFIKLCKRFDIFIKSNDDRLQTKHTP